MGRLLIPLLLIVVSALFGVHGFEEDERFIPDECFVIGTTCVRAQERMWLVNGIPHYWGSVLTFTGGALNNNNGVDNEDSAFHHRKDVKVTEIALAATMTSEWSNLSKDVTLDILRHDHSMIRTANPIDDSIHSVVKFTLNTGKEQVKFSEQSKESESVYFYRG